MTSLLRAQPHLDLLSAVEGVRLTWSKRLLPGRQSELGQFFTPVPVAELIASFSQFDGECTRVLDPGAGVGVLTAAWVSLACSRARPPKRIEVTLYELDEALLAPLSEVMALCQQYARERDVEFTWTVAYRDFISSAVASLTEGLFAAEHDPFDVVLTNPPYGKLRSDSSERSHLREVGIETGNLYAAFVALSLRLLRDGGEVLAITPRSFCNGPYFTPFRKDLLALGSLSHVHLFDSRDTAFGGDAVLQENVVYRVERGGEQGPVTVEWSSGGEIQNTVRRDLPFSEVVKPNDPDCFIHIAPNEWDSQVAGLVEGLSGRLSDLELQASTGRVVDFRIRDHLLADPHPDAVPLIYPMHIDGGAIVWPRLGAKKPNAIRHSEASSPLLNPSGTYVLVKRFSSKEERKRIVAATISPTDVPGKFVAFENHLNVFHRFGGGMRESLAAGLSAYLNSTVVDSYFRQFNGHTQVNATDLRKLPYPSRDDLTRVGERLRGLTLSQADLDEIVEEELFKLPQSKKPESKSGERRIADASKILAAMGLPKEQTNERAALTLLALLDVKPRTPWAKAANPLMGVTPIMEFAAAQYGKRWKPNTRETVRRFTLHQFQAAGVVVPNPDQPSRPVNSPAYCYQVPDVVLDLIRSFGSSRWADQLRDFLATAPGLAERYASERKLKRIALKFHEGKTVTLSPGGQNELIAKIIEDFCPVFTPGGIPLYIGDADEKWALFEKEELKRLGVTVDAHGKMPDVVIHFVEKGWLVLVEAVTSHGPVNAKRREELKQLFAKSSAPLVYVTAFLTRKALNKYQGEIAWETEVWVADAPTHLIHFNGERFLGPYDS